ncbi:hypothetical protein C943_00101 [Mariniradius saccharolyticus AK6]|uniref:Uncharacterized protein n=1 Tax=Mariniradius saccharolyticus AK6 TaxID=1239962 RepID=M7XLH9_9BACT|nr:hypothetical protein C943_00101 [Mariniradius saccharolyticus AK6]
MDILEKNLLNQGLKFSDSLFKSCIWQIHSIPFTIGRSIS